VARTRSRNFLGQLNSLLSGGTLTGLGEGQLLERYLSDRVEAAFAEIIARHGTMVLGICRRWLDDPDDVDDAFQATFLVLLRKAASLRDR
jgi:glycerate kinase